MFQDPLQTATGKLLKAVSGVAVEINRKRKIIEDAEKAVNAAKTAIDKAKSSLPG